MTGSAGQGQSTSATPAPATMETGYPSTTIASQFSEETSLASETGVVAPEQLYGLNESASDTVNGDEVATRAEGLLTDYDHSLTNMASTNWEQGIPAIEQNTSSQETAFTNSEDYPQSAFNQTVQEETVLTKDVKPQEHEVFDREKHQNTMDKQFNEMKKQEQARYPQQVEKQDIHTLLLKITDQLNTVTEDVKTLQTQVVANAA